MEDILENRGDKIIKSLHPEKQTPLIDQIDLSQGNFRNLHASNAHELLPSFSILDPDQRWRFPTTANGELVPLKEPQEEPARHNLLNEFILEEAKELSHIDTEGVIFEKTQHLGPFGILESSFGPEDRPLYPWIPLKPGYPKEEYHLFFEKTEKPFQCAGDELPQS
jgi:hypothetical protein